MGATPSTWNFRSAGPRWSEIADFEPIFARSASAVTPSKSSINTNRKSFFPMGPRMDQDEHRTLSLSAQRVAQKCKLSETWTISCDNSDTVRDRMSVKTINHWQEVAHGLSITNRPRWPWMILNGVIALILLFATEFDSFADRLRFSGRRDRPIMSVKYCLPVTVFHFWPKTNAPCSSVSLR